MLRHVLALACAWAWLGAATAVPAAVQGGSVAAFYYPWYGSPERDGSWQHWRAQPGSSFAAGFVPIRGAYSSTDPAVLDAHMADLVAARVDTLVVSWWGPGSVEDERLPVVAAAARSHGLEVALHVEPYPGRTPVGIVQDLLRLSDLGIRDAYVYDAMAHPATEWAAATAQLEGVRVLAHTTLPGWAAAGGFDGLYTYDVLVHDGRSFRRLCRQARAAGLLCAPSVGPGFDARRATGNPRVRPRRAGRTYDAMWRAAVRARPDIVTVTSYNEWHEGTQIEPARQAYDGAYGRTGEAAQRAYLERTALWAARYRGALPVVD